MWSSNKQQTVETKPKEKESVFVQRPIDAEVEEMYAAVLDSLLTTPPIKEQLIASQSIDKKWQFVKMNDQLLQDSNFVKSVRWGDKENSMLLALQRSSKTPDLQSFSKLKTILTSANREFMQSFIDAEGIDVLLKTIELRANKTTWSELDVALLFEILTCCKSVMNNAIGMDAFLSIENSVEVIARCLRFENKMLALIVNFF
jgi:hypothetical protein